MAFPPTDSLQWKAGIHQHVNPSIRDRLHPPEFRPRVSARPLPLFSVAWSIPLRCPLTQTWRSCHVNRPKLSGGHHPPPFEMQLIAAPLHAELNNALRAPFRLRQVHAVYRGMESRFSVRTHPCRPERIH
jgi:hypothetical protein